MAKGRSQPPHQKEQAIMENWRKTLRQGLAPELPTEGLLALRQALLNDDCRLLQGATTLPPPLRCMRDVAVQAACGIGYCSWQGAGLDTVAEVEEAVAQLCDVVDQRLGEAAPGRGFLD